jgi:hypothetical protein
MRGAVWLLAGAVTLGSCGADPEPTGPDLSASSPAAKAAAAATTRREAPSLVYDCDIWHPQTNTIEDFAARQYGVLTVQGSSYAFALEQGGAASGTLQVDAERKLSWTGDLGLIDDPPRRVTRAALTTYDDVVNLVWDFVPVIKETGHYQVICRGKAGAAP